MTRFVHDPKSNSRPVAIWLFSCCVMVAVMVTLGGLTRLTHSGLSMVEWRPLTFLPPLNEAEWEAAFAGYRQSPEFRQLNSDMTLTGFMGIFWLEYLHRLWGRVIGLAFALPLLYFAAKGMIAPRLTWRLALILVLGGMQGVLGWLMVKSGLADMPDVSPYRLAAHLLLAFLILGALLWTGLDLSPAKPSRSAQGLFAPLLGFSLLVLTAACWGALVAGLDGGLIYNSFPLMNGALWPEDALAYQPLPINLVGNPVLVQFIHRLLAMAVVLFATLLWLRGRKLGLGPLLPLLALWAWVQASLGVATLLLQVPVTLAAFHQAGALALFALCVGLLHRLRPATFSTLESQSISRPYSETAAGSRD
ncbi:Heme A synthase [Rhodospirillaceae bacterium LM-1]|nr:Heme A synthase [Rhodospirillaceae bacterium LM-1]